MQRHGAHEAFAARLGFSEWRGRSRLEEELFVWRFGFTGRELPAWDAVQVQRVPPSPAAPALVRSVWRSTRRGAERVVEVQVSECDSRLQAHELLLGTLRQFQSPLVRRQDELGLGDVAFAGAGRARGPTMLLFARGNLVYLVRNRAQSVVSVLDAAEGCDHAVTERPPAVRSVPVAGPPSRRQARAARERFPVELDPALLAAAMPAAVEDPAPVLGRAFARGGELTREDGELVFRPGGSDGGVVELVAQGPAEAAAGYRVEVPGR